MKWNWNGSYFNINCSGCSYFFFVSFCFLQLKLIQQRIHAFFFLCMLFNESKSKNVESNACTHVCNMNSNSSGNIFFILSIKNSVDDVAWFDVNTVKNSAITFISLVQWYAKCYNYCLMFSDLCSPASHRELKKKNYQINLNE